FFPALRRSEPFGPADLRSRRFRHAGLRSGARIFFGILHALSTADGPRISYDHSPSTAAKISPAALRHHRSGQLVDSLHCLGVEAENGKSRRRVRHIQSIRSLFSLFGIAEVKSHVCYLPDR